MVDVALSKAQQAALKWLTDRNGVAFAQGETAPVERKTWNALAKAGKIEFYGGKQTGGSGYGRLRVIIGGYSG